MDQDYIKHQINEWYTQFSNDIYQYIYLMIRDHEQAKDLMQDTFIRAFDKFSTFHDENAKGWLFRIARNITIDYLRRNKPIAYFFDKAPIISGKEGIPEEIVSLHETTEELYVALGKIKTSFRDVIILRKIKRFSIQETADILGWKESKVKSTLFRGIKELKEQLEKEGYVHEEK
ncbi:RNA polymerase sigma factor [Evansella sp. AB-rgal1]|uniref:RNA polymerase sigma factor n=1 Tax=Evansella sp. AB-rgal1 TaxID=3242696 RepID=UPI00359E9698